jgi:hypothetical protein
MKNENNLPPISSSIINKLEEVFPLRDDFDTTTGQNALMFYYGQRSVIRYLTNQHKLQNETILNKS